MFASDGLTVEELSFDDWRDTVGGAAAPVRQPQAQSGRVADSRSPGTAVDEWLRAAFVAERRIIGRPALATRPQSAARGTGCAGLAGARAIYWLWLAGAALALWLQAA
jgi:hypothetical protein